MKIKWPFFAFLILLLVCPIFFGLNSLNQKGVSRLDALPPENKQFTSINTKDGGDSITIQSYYCSDFQDAPLKVWRLMDDFYFVFDSTTLHYGLYLGAMFVEGDDNNVSLVIYAFVMTLTEYYVSNLGMTLIFNLTGSYRGIYFQQNGTRSDTAPWILGGSCQCDFSLYSQQFTRDLNSYDLTLSIDYSLTSSEFSENGVFGCTESLPAATADDIRRQRIITALIIIGVIVGIIVIIITSIVIINKRRRRMANGKIPSHWAFSKTRDTGDEGATPTQYVSAPQARPSVEAPEVVSPPPTASRLLEEEREEPVISREPVRTETYSLETVGKLLDDLKYGGRYSRLKAIESLGNSGYTSAVPALVNVLLHDKDPELRAKAAISLGLIGDPDIKPILRRVLNEDSDVNVRNSVADALNIIEGFEDL